MGLPATVTALPPDLVEPEAARATAERFGALLGRLRAERPAPGSNALRSVMAEWLEMVAELGPVWAQAMDAGVDDWFLSTARSEIEEDPTIERRLALRWLESALDTLVRLFALFRRLLPDRPAPRADLVPLPTSGGGSLPPEIELTLQLQLDIFVALECLDDGAEPDELAFWCRRAHRSAADVELLIPAPLDAVVRGNRARQEAASAWDDWDEEEIAREVIPWPGPP